MIQLKNAEQLDIMKIAGRITGEALALAGEHVKDGVTTKYIDDVIRTYIEKHDAHPSFLGYGGFPGSACISINDEVIHGIPSGDRVMREGDIVKIDVGAYYRGFHGDSANTFTVGKVSETASKLIEVTKNSFFEGLNAVKIGGRIGDISAAIDGYVRSFGFSVVRKYVGHGVGKNLHEAPDVPNFGTAGRGPRLAAGMTMAIEPMVNVGDYTVRELDDNWTVVTTDGSLSAHYEHTIALTEDGVILLTLIE